MRDAYLEAMDYVTARDDRTNHRLATFGVHVPTVRQPDARGHALRRRPRQARGSRSDSAPRARRGRRDCRHVGSVRRVGARPVGRRHGAAPARTTLPPSPSRPAHSRRDGAGSRSERPVSLSTGSPTSVLISNTRSCRCPVRFPIATSCARRTVSGARCWNTSCKTSCTRPTSSPTIASTMRSQHSTRCCEQPTRRRASCSCPGSTAPMRPEGAPRCAAPSCTCHSRHIGATSCAPTVEGIAHNLGWLLPHVEAFTGERIGEIAFMGGAARSEPWCQILADVLGCAVLPLADPELGAARAMALRALGQTATPDMTTNRYDPDPASRALLRDAPSSVRGRVRGPASHQRGPLMSSSYPYAQTHDVIRGMPSEGRSRDSILTELEGFANDEDRMWETGKCSGTMYCGDHEHYEFMGRAFELFAHVNALQRDMCPSMTKFEGEIIAMTLDMLHADSVTDTEVAGLVTSGGSGSILHAVLAYREAAAAGRAASEPRQSRDGAPRVRQGVPPARRRVPAGAGRHQDDPSRSRRDRRSG